MTFCKFLNGFLISLKFCVFDSDVWNFFHTNTFWKLKTVFFWHVSHFHFGTIKGYALSSYHIIVPCCTVHIYMFFPCEPFNSTVHEYWLLKLTLQITRTVWVRASAIWIWLNLLEDAKWIKLFYVPWLQWACLPILHSFRWQLLSWPCISICAYIDRNVRGLFPHICRKAQMQRHLWVKYFSPYMMENSPRFSLSMTKISI